MDPVCIENDSPTDRLRPRRKPPPLSPRAIIRMVTYLQGRRTKIAMNTRALQTHLEIFAGLVSGRHTCQEKRRRVVHMAVKVFPFFLKRAILNDKRSI